MNGGDLVQVGTPQEIYDRPSSVFVAKFVGTPSINLLSVSAEEADGTLVLRLAKGGQKIGGAVARARLGVSTIGPSRRSRDPRGPPEAIALGSTASPDAVPAVIDVVEPMGSVNNIVLRLDGIDSPTVDGDPLMAVVTSNETFAPGARTWLTLRPERLVLFAIGSEAAFAALFPSPPVAARPA